MKGRALLIGNSHGIGLATTQEMLRLGWKVVGISRSKSPVEDPSYEHVVAEVQSDGYVSQLRSLLTAHGPPEVCIYCAGVGELLDLSDMQGEIEIFEVNLVGMVKTASCVIPLMVGEGRGHFIGLSSMADELLSAEAPSYHASKAGFSSYLESLALALKDRGVRVTNVRFGFVDTKMAKGDIRPLMMDVGSAARHLLSCIEKRPARHSAPRLAVPLVKFRSWMLRFRLG